METQNNYNFTQWFETRNLKQLGYQSEKMQDVITSIANQELPTVFAACPSAGKTLMSICMIDTILKDNPNFRVLVLAHGTNVLRSQYAEEVAGANPDFTHCEVTNKQEMEGCDAQVVVAIPQSIKAVKKLPKFDLVVVDEAHQFYFADMVQNIIRKVGAKHQLLLTGTPSIFIKNEFPLITVTVNEILDYDMVEDLTVVVASSNYRINRTDFNASGDVREDYEFQEEETNNTLDDFLSVLESKLKSVLKEFTALEAGLSALTGWHLPLKALDKTMVVARSQHQATQIRNYFLRKKVNVALSTSDTDANSTEIQRFKQDDDCRVLIVVGRGILGFSFPRMINVVDMSGTQNIDRIFQLMCRVIRKHPDGKKKFFFKIAPKDLEHNYEYIMTATMCLCDESYYTKYNGDNFLDLEIPVVRTPRPQREPREDDEPREPRTPRSTDIRPVEFLGLPEGIRFFKDLLHKDNGEAMVNHSFAKIREVKYLLGDYERVQRGYWTKENCIAQAKNFNRIVDWQKTISTSYNVALKNGWLNECTEHMTAAQKSVGYWTKENCLKEAKKYNTRTDWQKKSAGSYDKALKNKWVDELSTHMIIKLKPRGYWTKEKCIEESKQYNTTREWKEKSGSSYTTARKNGWLEECKNYFKK
jgi:superfamily II DNA or RNA helicase